MPTNDAKSAISVQHGQKSRDNDSATPLTDDSLTAIAERLAPSRTVPNDVLGAAVVDAGLCLDETTDPARPGWLFDDTIDRDTAAHMCAHCPVRYVCLELELRLFGAAKLGMWGALGEDGRRALHPVWLQARESTTDVESRGDRR